MSVNVPKTGWRVVKFGDVVRSANLVERNPNEAGIERVVGLEHLDTGDLHIRRWDTVKDSTSFTRRFRSGQALFGKRRAYQRKVAYAEFDGICSGDILTFESKNPDVLLPELLPFICRTDAFFDHALGTSAGSLSPRTSWSALQDFEFTLPPLAEQKRIAQILWAADDSIENWRTALRILGRTMGAISSHLLELPGARLVKLGDMISDHQVEVINGPFGTVLKASSYVSEGTSLVNPTHIQDGLLDVANSPRLSDGDAKRLAKYLTLRGDILLGRKGGMDKILFIHGVYEGVITGTDCLRLRVLSSALNSRYLYSWLRSPHVIAWLSRFAHGTTMPGINEKTLHYLDIPVVPRGYQDQIVEKLGGMEQSRGVIREHIDATVALQKMLVGSSL